MRAAAETAAVPLVVAGRRVVERPIRMAAHPAAALLTKAYSKAPAVAAVVPLVQPDRLVAPRVAAVPRARWAVERPATWLVAVVPQVAPTRTPAAACKAAAELKAVDQLAAAEPRVAARLAVVERKAAAPRAVAVPKVVASQVVLAVTRRPGAEPPAVAAPTVRKVVRRAAVLRAAAVA